MSTIQGRNLDKFLNLILEQFINYENDEHTKYTRCYELLRDTIIDCLIKHDNVKISFGGSDLEGSCRDNVRIGLPNEFDLVIVLDFSKLFDLSAELVDELPGFIKVKCSGCKMESKHFKDMVTDDGYLRRDLLQQWLQSTMAMILNSIKNEIIYRNDEGEEEVYSLKYQTLGPAHTLTMIDNRSESLLSIDFVPGIRLPLCTTDGGKQYSSVMAIPKKPKQLDANSEDIYFRRSHYKKELDYMKGHNHLKNVLRILKKFRDVHSNMANFESYYIKTLVLWKSRNTDINYWNLPVSQIVFEMFLEMEDSLRNKRLPYFWDQNANLFCYLNDNQLMSMLQCVESARKRLSKVLWPRNIDDVDGVWALLQLGYEIFNFWDAEEEHLPQEVAIKSCEHCYSIFLSRQEIKELQRTISIKKKA